MIKLRGEKVQVVGLAESTGGGMSGREYEARQP